MQYHLLTLFPEALKPYTETSILKRAAQQHAINLTFWNLRDFTTDKHRTVDDTPYGGGAGMVLKVEPIAKALEAIKTTSSGGVGEVKTIVLSPHGAPFTQAKAEEYAEQSQLILIAGRYEGIDQRVIDHLADEEVSVGPYVLSGGELPALVIIEAVTRLLPGVLGNAESLDDATFSFPQYTKPEAYQGWRVPEVLLSGDHQAIERWRTEHQKR
jgi:tRNA (guanine37-N1)-methyltransferase